MTFLTLVLLTLSTTLSMVSTDMKANYFVDIFADMILLPFAMDKCNPNHFNSLNVTQFWMFECIDSNTVIKSVFTDEWCINDTNDAILFNRTISDQTSASLYDFHCDGIDYYVNLQIVETGNSCWDDDAYDLYLATDTCVSAYDMHTTDQSSFEILCANDSDSAVLRSYQSNDCTNDSEYPFIDNYSCWWGCRYFAQYGNYTFKSKSLGCSSTANTTIVNIGDYCKYTYTGSGDDDDEYISMNYNFGILIHIAAIVAIVVAGTCIVVCCLCSQSKKGVKPSSQSKLGDNIEQTSRVQGEDCSEIITKIDENEMLVKH